MRYLLFILITLLSVQLFSQDTIEKPNKIMSQVNPIKLCSVDRKKYGGDYAILTDSPKNYFFDQVEVELKKIDMSPYPPDCLNFGLSCDINCKGEVGNWQISESESLRMKNKVLHSQLIHEVASALSRIKFTKPMTSMGGKPFNVNIFCIHVIIYKNGLSVHEAHARLPIRK